MDYYLWSRPQNKPFFETRSKQKTFLAVVGRQESSPGDVGFMTKHKTEQCHQLAAGALADWVWLHTVFFSSDGENCKSHS